MNDTTIIEQPTIEEIQTETKKLLAKRLSITESEVDLNKTFTGYGLDSIDAITLIGDLEDQYDIELPSTLLWDFNNINEMAEYVANNFKDLTL
ncbi:MAG TPA: acyl carrier protein [Kangiella sp.]|uniref:acyl carrier protein n=1 Tax=Kangiella sp. TaxID=1920245 RepID=UPI002F939545